MKIGACIEQALGAAALSQRTLAQRSGVSQSTLSRIITGDRVAKMPEIVAIAWVTGRTVAQLTGTSTAADRAQCAARAANGSTMDGMYQTLLHYLELDDYLRCARSTRGCERSTTVCHPSSGRICSPPPSG